MCKLFLLALSVVTLLTNQVFATQEKTVEPNKLDVISLHYPFDMMERQFSIFDDYWHKTLHSSSIRAKYITEDKQYIIVMEIPGYDKDHIKIKANANRLFITGNIEDQKGNKATDHLSKRFNYTLTLQDDVDQKSISSSIKHGVLTITLPRIEITDKNAKEIPIN